MRRNEDSSDWMKKIENECYAGNQEKVLIRSWIWRRRKYLMLSTRGGGGAIIPIVRLLWMSLEKIENATARHGNGNRYSNGYRYGLSDCRFYNFRPDSDGGASVYGKTAFVLILRSMWHSMKICAAIFLWNVERTVGKPSVLWNQEEWIRALRTGNLSDAWLEKRLREQERW